MGTIRNLGAIDLTPQPCGHVGPHEPIEAAHGGAGVYLGFPANGRGEVCEHWVWKSRQYRQRGFTPVHRWRLECSCGYDIDEWTETAALAMFATHRENELTLAAAYLPANVELPWRDS